VGAVPERFDLLADGPHLRFSRVRLHYDQHEPTSKGSSLSSKALDRKPHRIWVVAQF
jgi:hypothetical protein